MRPGRQSNNMTFVILSPEPNIGRLKGTVRSIRNNYCDGAMVVCAVAKSIKKPELEEMKEVCPTFRGGETVTSLMNAGLKHAEEGWCMFIMEGAWLPRNIESRYFRWVEGEKDVLFPIVVTYDIQGVPTKILSEFSECTLNGILIHKNLFTEVGKFSDNPIKISKEFWGLEAASKGTKFKAILGVKIC
jgi:hypothetical protein